MAVTECRGENYDPLEHHIKAFIVTEDDLAFLLNELWKVQNLEHEMYQLWLRDNDGEKWLAHVQDIGLILSEHAQKGSSAPLILLSHIVKRVSNYAPISGWQVWSLLEPHLPGQRGQWGGIAQDNRRFINAVFWVLRTGAPWRDLPPDYGKWGSVHQRFIRWRRKGVWEKLLETLIDEPDYEWLMIDVSHIKVHPNAAGAKGGNQDMSKTKGGSTPKYIWPWMRMVCQSESLLQKVPERIVKKLST